MNHRALSDEESPIVPADVPARRTNLWPEGVEKMNYEKREFLATSTLVGIRTAEKCGCVVLEGHSIPYVLFSNVYEADEQHRRGVR